MKKIILHGLLKKYFCSSFNLKVNKFKDIFFALCSNYSNYNFKMKSLYKKFGGFVVILDGKIFHKDYEDLDFLINDVETIEIIPCLVFGFFGTLVAVLIAVGLSKFLAYVVAFIITIAISIGISYLISLLLRPGDPKQLKTSSYIISTKDNIAARNTPIALNYGRLKTGSSVINACLYNFDSSYASTTSVVLESSLGSISVKI